MYYHGSEDKVHEHPIRYSTFMTIPRNEDKGYQRNLLRFRESTLEPRQVS